MVDCLGGDEQGFYELKEGTGPLGRVLGHGSLPHTALAQKSLIG